MEWQSGRGDRCGVRVVGIGVALCAASAPAWAAGGFSGLKYVFIGFAFIVTVVAAVIVTWRAVEVLKAKGGGFSSGGVEAAAADARDEPRGSNTSPIDVSLLDMIELPEGVLVYVLQMNDRILLIGKHKYGVAGLGDFPASSLQEIGSRSSLSTTYKPVATASGRVGPKRAAAAASASVAQRLARDEREWERRREALIRLLQEGGE